MKALTGQGKRDVRVESIADPRIEGLARLIAVASVGSNPKVHVGWWAPSAQYRPQANL